jgi:hypothetical protein
VKLIKISLCQGLSHITVLQYLPAIPKNINVIAARNSKGTRTERKKNVVSVPPKPKQRLQEWEWPELPDCCSQSISP